MLYKNHKKTAILLLSTLSISIQAAHAGSSFSSSGQVNYTINNITNQNNPGSTDGLEIAALFDLDANQSYSSSSGDGSFTITPDQLNSVSLSPSAGSNFIQTFQVYGDVNNGTVETYQLALIDLNLANNSSSDIYDIEISLSYDLSSETLGDSGQSGVSIDYYTDNDATSDFTGSELIETFSEPLSLNNASLNSTDTLNFILSPGSTHAIFSEIVIDGSLTAVPIPTAFWLFGSALAALPALRKNQAIRKNIPGSAV